MRRYALCPCNADGRITAPPIAKFKSLAAAQRWANGDGRHHLTTGKGMTIEALKEGMYGLKLIAVETSASATLYAHKCKIQLFDDGRTIKIVGLRVTKVFKVTKAGDILEVRS